MEIVTRDHIRTVVIASTVPLHIYHLWHGDRNTWSYTHNCHCLKCTVTYISSMSWR